MSRIQQIAVEMYGEELNESQIKYIKAVMSNNIVIMPRVHGKTAAIRVLQQYVEEGLENE